MADIPENTMNCPVNNERLKNLEGDMIEVKKDVSAIKDQNNGQNEILAQIKTVHSVFWNVCH